MLEYREDLEELAKNINRYVHISDEFQYAVKTNVEALNKLKLENVNLKFHLYTLIRTLNEKGVELPQPSMWWYEEECQKQALCNKAQ